MSAKAAQTNAPESIPDSATKRSRRDGRRENTERSMRTLLFILLLLVVVVILAGAIMFTDNSRVFLVKFAAAGILSILPGWIYLQFIRNKGHSLYDEYVLNLFRLKIDEVANLPAPPEHTSSFGEWQKAHRGVVPGGVTDNLYRRKFESVYGTSAVSTIGLVKSERLTLKEKTETFAPVVMATIVIAVAWTLILQPELLSDINLIRGDFALAEGPDLPLRQLTYGFLGAYAFVLLNLGRRYFREDLKSAAYVSATTRIIFASTLIVAVYAAGVETYVSEGQANLVAFFIGFFPRAGFTWLRAILPGGLKAAVPQLESDYPLRELEGLNIWYESRLIEEGIESVQNLCSANLVDLLLKTRIPVVRVIDWLDQAFLYLHLSKHPELADKPPPSLAALRGLGIRTATELERVWALAEGPPPDGMLKEVLGRALIPEDPQKIDAVMRATILSFSGEPNLWHVRAFRDLTWLKDQPSIPKGVVGDAEIRLDDVQDKAGDESPAMTPPVP